MAGRRRRESLVPDLVRLTVLWLVVVVATVTMLAPTPIPTNGRDVVFNVFTGAMRDMVRPFAVAFDVAGLILLPIAWAFVRRRG